MSQGARRRARGAGLLALAALPLLGGCVSEQREQELGDQIAATVNARVPLVRDAPLNLYVNDLGRLIARHSGRPGVDYHFYIVDTDGVNAFALPGGHVYINRGLIERTRNVSELAGVLAHEIAHVSARHGAHALERQMRTSSISSLMYRMILGRGPILDQEALQLGTQLWSAEHSRADEAEADRMAVEYLVASGVDPRGMLTLFTTLLDEEERNPRAPSSEWFATHPNTERRLEVTRQEILQLTPKVAKGLARDNASYPRFLQRLNALPPPPPVLIVN